MILNKTNYQSPSSQPKLNVKDYGQSISNHQPLIMLLLNQEKELEEPTLLKKLEETKKTLY